MGIRKVVQKIFPGISARLIISFGLLFAGLVFIAAWVNLQGIPFTSLKGRIEIQREETFKDLNQIADNKKANLLNFIYERRGDTLVTARNASVASEFIHLRQRVDELTEAGIGGPGLWSLLARDETYLDLAGYLSTIRDVYGYYDNIQIADAETGIVYVSTDNSTLGTDLSNEPFLINALLTQNIYISDITAQPEDQLPAMYFSHLVPDGQGGAAGVLVMKVDTGVIINIFLQAGPLLEENAETLLVNQKIEILTPLKYPLADGTTAELLQYKITALPAQLAARGEEGIIETLDYRGEKVLAAYRHISLSTDWGWGMVVKSDSAALFAPMRAAINNTLVISGFSAALFIVLAILITQTITKPIRLLTTTAKSITGGDLSERAKIMSSDEIGILARAFNQMAESLVTAQTGLEEEVRERTSELELEIVERIQAEQKLVNSENLLNITQRIAKVGGWMWNVENKTMFWTDETYRIHEIDPSEIETGSSEHIERGAKCYDEKDRPIILDAFQKCADDGMPYDLEFPFTTVKGKKIWIRTAAQAEKENGEVVRVIGNMIDITERVRAEEELKKSEEKFRGLSDLLPQIIYEINLEGKFTYINKIAPKLTGYTSEEFERGIDFSQLFSKEDNERAKKNMQKIVFENELGINEYTIIKKNGDLMPILVYSSAIIENDKPCGLRGIVLDLTERQKAEEELKKHRFHLEGLVEERTAELEEKNTELERFNKLFSGREIRIKELRDMVTDLEKRLGDNHG